MPNKHDGEGRPRLRIEGAMAARLGSAAVGEVRGSLAARTFSHRWCLQDAQTDAAFEAVNQNPARRAGPDERWGGR